MTNRKAIAALWLVALVGCSEEPNGPPPGTNGAPVAAANAKPDPILEKVRDLNTRYWATQFYKCLTADGGDLYVDRSEMAAKFFRDVQFDVQADTVTDVDALNEVTWTGLGIFGSRYWRYENAENWARSQGSTVKIVLQRGTWRFIRFQHAEVVVPPDSDAFVRKGRPHVGSRTTCPEGTTEVSRPY